MVYKARDSIWVFGTQQHHAQFMVCGTVRVLKLTDHEALRKPERGLLKEKPRFAAAVRSDEIDDVGCKGEGVVEVEEKIAGMDNRGRALLGLSICKGLQGGPPTS